MLETTRFRIRPSERCVAVVWRYERLMDVFTLLG